MTVRMEAQGSLQAELVFQGETAATHSTVQHFACTPAQKLCHATPSLIVRWHTGGGAQLWPTGSWEGAR